MLLCMQLWQMEKKLPQPVLSTALNNRKSDCVSRWMEILLSWKLVILKNIFPVYNQNKYCHLHGKELQEMKDSLIHIPHEQDPEPILAKVIKNLKPLAQQKESHDVNQGEGDGWREWYVLPLVVIIIIVQYRDGKMAGPEKRGFSRHYCKKIWKTVAYLKLYAFGDIYDILF